MERDGDGIRSIQSATVRQGLIKLMLKLPAVRGQLQTLVLRSSSSLVDLCEAYGEATSELERLERSGKTDDAPAIEEYRRLCADIENDVLRYFVENSSRSGEI